MNYRMVTRRVEAQDGTRLAHHTHLPPGPDGEGLEASLKGRPTVQLTSGIGTTANFWRYLIEVLVTDQRVVHWDYRGHGYSENSPTDDYRIETLVDDLIRVTEETLRHGDGKRPPVHVGFSMGVAIVLELYRRRPELVPAMVLIAGAAEAPGTGALPPWAMKGLKRAVDTLTPVVPKVAPLVSKVLSSPLVYPAGRLTGVLRRRAPKEDVEFMMRELAQKDLMAFWRTLSGLLAVNASDVLPTVKVPVLIIAPENDLMMPVSQVQKLRQNLPHAKFVSVRDAGHAGLLEAGTEVSQAVHAFVRELNSDGGAPPRRP